MPLGESLHNHTVHSDGMHGYLEMLDAAWLNGIGVVAFTDHDYVPSRTLLDELRAYSGPCKWLIGCELTASLPPEVDPTGGRSVHILGLFVNPRDLQLQIHCRRMEERRIERVKQIVANLKARGFTISVEDCARAASHGTIGRPHIVRALELYPENEIIMDLLLYEAWLLTEAGDKPRSLFDRLMVTSPRDLPYQLFLGPDAIIDGVYVPTPETIGLDECVRLIHQAGGEAILAHWWSYGGKFGLAELETLLRQGRVDGIELPLAWSDELIETGRKLEDLARETGVLTTYGADAHSTGDYEYFAARPELAEQTAGQTRRLIDRASPNLRWSNLEG